MKRRGVHRPSVEDAIELSGIETLHPGGLALTRRTGEVGGLRPGLSVLDVSSGRGTQALFYARTFDVSVTGVDISEEMVRVARARAEQAGLSDRVRFELGDSQKLLFPDQSFDVVINECAVGIPDDSQAVLNEMVRVVRPGGSVVIHESTWRRLLSPSEKDELAERYGTTPLDAEQWTSMLLRAGVRDLQSELEPWSQPEMFWNIRQERQVRAPSRILSLRERLRLSRRIVAGHGLAGLAKAFENERRFFRAVRAGKLGYGLYWGRRPGAADRA